MTGTPAAGAAHAPGAPENSIQTPDGRRWYVHPTSQQDGEFERFVSVTTAFGGIEKPGLKEWYGQQAAQLAADSLPLLLQAAMEEPCEKTGAERCRRCLPCSVLWMSQQGQRESARRSDEGQRLHSAVKLWIKLGCRPDFTPEMDEEIRPYFRQFVTFFLDHGLTASDVFLSEVTVLNRAHGYAGTLDIGVRVRASASWQAAELVAMLTGWPAGEVFALVDVKTREREEDLFTHEMAMQLAGYRNGEVIMHPDGAEEPMPKTDGGVIVQVHPESYTIRPVDTGPDVFAAFVQHLSVIRWQWEEGGKVAGVRRFPLPDEMRTNDTGDFPTVEAALKRILAEHPGRKPAVKAMRARIKAERVRTERGDVEPAAGHPAPVAGDAPSTNRPRPATSRQRPARDTASNTGRRSVTASADPFAIADRATRRPGALLADEDIPF